MKIGIVYLLLVFTFPNIVSAQDSLWTLELCINFSKNNNISIQENVLNERLAKLQWEQSKYSQLPDISLSSSYGRSYGRSIDPTTNNFINTNYDFTGLSGSASVLIFGWFQKRNAIAKNELLHKASEADLNQLEKDLSLNITTGFLRILLAKEQIKISLKQLDISNRQLKKTESLLAAGRSNGQDVAQVKTQLATDSTNYFKAILLFNQSTIEMKALLNFDLDKEFIVAPFDNYDIEIKLLGVEPLNVYNEALLKFDNIKSSSLKIQSAQKDLAIAKGQLYPQLNMSFSSGTNFSSTSTELLSDGSYRVIPMGKQLQNNFSQSIYIGLSIPIFNGLSSKYAIKQARINVEANKLQDRDIKLKLKQDIYKAFNDMQSAYQTYKASVNAATYAALTLDFARKRYEKGLITGIDLLLAQNTCFRADIDASSSKYDLIFKQLVIDYYLGKGVFETK